MTMVGYAIPSGADPEQYTARASALGTAVLVNYPGLTSYPSVAITGDGLAPVQLADDGTLTTTDIQTALAPFAAAAEAATTGLGNAQTGIDSLLAQQSALASQIATDAAMFAATPVGSTLTAEHIAALIRIVNGFSTTMQAITAHLMLTGNAPPTTPLS